MLASQLGHTQTVRLSLDSGAEVDIAAETGFNSLLLTNSRCHSDIVEMLIKNGATGVNISGPMNEIPLMQSRYSRRARVVRLLLESGAHVDAVDKKYHSSLLIASSHGHTEIVTMPLASGAQVDIAICYDSTYYTHVLLALLFHSI